MQKTGHLLIAKQMECLYPQYHFWLSLGSILPDLLIHTYIKGHTFEAAKRSTFKRMRQLEERGRWNRRSCLMLGYVLHYVEDFFTYPHNITYQKMLKDHILYEREQYHFLKRNKETFSNKYETIENIVAWISEKHEEYLMTSPGFEADLKYVMLAVQSIIVHFDYVFKENELAYEVKHDMLIHNVYDIK